MPSQAVSASSARAVRVSVRVRVARAFALRACACSRHQAPACAAHGLTTRLRVAGRRREPVELHEWPAASASRDCSWRARARQLGHVHGSRCGRSRAAAAGARAVPRSAVTGGSLRPRSQARAVHAAAHAPR
eukprot:6205476-Pleurochrysis_carterae.AAC.1